jgi:formylglycine-generating enzyme required for sulfatase activity
VRGISLADIFEEKRAKQMFINHNYDKTRYRFLGLLAGILILAACTVSCSGEPLPAQPPTETAALLTQNPTETQLPPTSTPKKLPPTETAPATPAPTDTAEPTLTATATALPESIEDPAGVPMVLVPAGSFTMGSDTNQAEARPAHTVYLDAYYIDTFEVTNRLYQACADAGECITGGGTYLRNPVFAEYPAMDVTWYAAQKYCEWRGGSLPTEAQWEKAARGTDERKFPWGNDPINCQLARYGDCGWFAVPVGQHPEGASPYGAQDMAGNAWEWTHDWYAADYYSVSPEQNPTGPEESTGWKSTRGGAWFYEGDLMSSIWRNHAPPTAHYLYVGFRCARTP